MHGERHRQHCVILTETDTEWLFSRDTVWVADGGVGAHGRRGGPTAPFGRRHHPGVDCGTPRGADEGANANSGNADAVGVGVGGADAGIVGLGAGDLVSVQSQTDIVWTKDRCVNTTPAAVRDACVGVDECKLWEYSRNESTEDYAASGETGESCTHNFLGQGTANGSHLRLMHELNKSRGEWLCVDNASLPMHEMEREAYRRREADLLRGSRADFVSKISIIERMTLQATEHELQVAFKGGRIPEGWLLPNSHDEETDPAYLNLNTPIPTLFEITSQAERFAQHCMISLWKYEQKQSLKVPRQVSCMSWNAFHKEMVAVSYVPRNSVSGPTPGVILVWSASNSQYPLLSLHARNSVLSLAFSTLHPALLAGGLEDGSIAVFDLRATPSGLYSCVSSPITHSSAVWEVLWVERGIEGEYLLSAGADGKVNKWTYSQGVISHVEVITRFPNVPNTFKTHGLTKSHFPQSTLLASHAGVLCLDVHPVHKNVIIVGTESGVCFKYVNPYQPVPYAGHTAPITACKWSHFEEHVFASCGGDWRVCLWDCNSPSAPLTVLNISNTFPPTDLCWYKQEQHTIAVSVGNSVQLWNTSKSTLDPFAIKKFTSQVSRVLFSNHYPVLLVATTNGAIHVVRMLSPLVQLQQQNNTDSL
ncbi:WD repeat domain 78 [Pelomyxa schiedti]|nr:WD repeat domain 78 [Pelomyxa schiedti]